jgi:hypothetical protein
MESDGETQVTAEFIAGDAPVSSNGFGSAAPAPAGAANPAVLVAAALVGGFLLARLLRRRREH